MLPKDSAVFGIVLGVMVSGYGKYSRVVWGVTTKYSAYNGVLMKRSNQFVTNISFLGAVVCDYYPIRV